MKENKVCLTNLVAEKLSYLSPRERERVRISRKTSQALSTISSSDFKATIRMSLTRGITVTTEDVALAEKTFGPDIGGLKGKTTRSKPLPMQSQAIGVPRELLSFHEEVETSLDGLRVNGQFFTTSISHETC